MREALAFRQARLARYPEHVVSEYYLDINEGLASYTGTVLAAPSAEDAIARARELLAGAEDGTSMCAPLRTIPVPRMASCWMPLRQAGHKGCAPATSRLSC